MNKEISKRLPLGMSDFSTLRKKNAVYVDKTALIAQMVNDGDKIFIARPRRFGKSLLVSTLESLFRYGVRDFEGLAIEKIWNDKTYKVLRLDFSRIEPFETLTDFVDNYHRFLMKATQSSGLDCEFQSVESAYDDFEKWLDRQESDSLVVLIDEYDAPLTRTLDSVELSNAIRSKLSALYSLFKSSSRVLHFLFMTGVTQFTGVGIFSVFNDLNNISWDQKYADLLGYTREELIVYFDAHLKEATNILGLSREELLNEMARYYDGFCFEKTAKTHVFAPWSVLNFLTKPKEGFVNYWFESAGQSTGLMKYLLTQELRDPKQYAQEQIIPLYELRQSSEIDHVRDIVLLTQAGYYSIDHVDDANYAHLKYPNKEVEDSMAQLYGALILRNRAPATINNCSLKQVMKNGEVDKFVVAVNATM